MKVNHNNKQNKELRLFNMTKTEEALCNGITFSVPRMVPTAIQEGELDNALYYVLVYLTPQLNKMVLKIYEAPSYRPLKWNDKDIDCITLDIEKIVKSDSENALVGYNFGYLSDGEGTVHPHGDWIHCNQNCAYDGLMLYPGLKCLIINIINEILSQSN